MPTIMRRLDLTFSALLPPLDFLALLGAAVTAYALRFSKFFTEIRPVITDIPFPDYLLTGSLFTLIWLVLFAMAGLYSIRQLRIWDMMGRVIVGSTAGIMVVIGIVFFAREFQTSRFVVLAVWALAILYVIVSRIILTLLRKAILRGRIGHLRTVVIGNGKTGQDIARIYKHRPVLGFSVIKQTKTWNDSAKAEIRDLARKGKVDVLLLADTELDRQAALDVIAFAEEHNLEFRYLADPFSATFTRVEMDAVGGIPILEVKRTPLDGWGRIFKRLFDIIISAILLAITSPILLASIIALWIEDGRPCLFVNERIGERGRSFNLLKLRSMWRKYSIGPQFGKTKENLKLEAELIKEKSIKDGPVYKIAEDPRVTRVGKFIRRWSIDELPQFLNVFMGNMSLVGPRPHQPREVEGYLPHHRRVLAIKPGITGLAQISGRSDLEFEDEVRLDSWYIEHWTPALDLYILLKTPFVVLRKKGAY